MLSNQEVFDIVLFALRKQGSACFIIDEAGFTKCKYRDGKGNKCAAGHILPDEEYSEDFEGKTASYIDWLCQNTNMDLLGTLQKAHDNSLLHRGIQVWEQAMEFIANKYNLIYTAP